MKKDKASMTAAEMMREKFRNKGKNDAFGQWGDFNDEDDFTDRLPDSLPLTKPQIVQKAQTRKYKVISFIKAICPSKKTIKDILIAVIAGIILLYVAAHYSYIENFTKALFHPKR